jgi:hypothetical protein
MAFIADIRHWATPVAFAAHLARHVPPGWAEGVTIHHTDKPAPSQWAGEASVKGALRYYEETRKWDRGPHLFLCVGAPNPANDGIWQLTPLNVASIHAGRCNVDHWGVEVVGNYDHAPWPHKLAELVYSTTLALVKWAKLPPDAVNGHRECLNNKTCPGKTISLPAVRAEMARRFATPPPAPPLIPVTADASLLSSPRCSLEQARRLFAKRGPWGEYTEYDVMSVILPAYWQKAQSLGLDPCLAVAQMAHETGWLNSFWSQRPQRNPAGIGVDGTKYPGKPANSHGFKYNTQRQMWEKGLSFGSWVDDSVPAHVGRLLAWALPPGTGTLEQRAAVNRALAYRALTEYARGSAPRLKALGRVHNATGIGWASPGTRYGEAIAAVMNEMRSQ